MPAITSSAPGKMILCGEHAVVYNQPAVAIPVLTLFTKTSIFARPTAPKGEIFIRADAISLAENLNILPNENPIRQTIELVKEYFSLESLPACEIHITSTLPVAAGMGSSASLAISLIRALSEFIGHPLPVDQVNSLAFEAEKVLHGNPSGVDNTVIVYEKPVFFQRDHKPELLKVAAPFHFVVANTGITASTSKAVARVRTNWQNDREKYENIFSQIGQISRQIREFLELGKFCETGELLTQDHTLLQEMGVSCPELDKFVKISLQAGALGAKLSGGGMGGNMLAMVTTESADRVAAVLASNGAKKTLHITLPASVEE